MELPHPEKPIYGYIISPGNNSQAIEHALKKRNVWAPFSPEKELLSASFFWKQLNFPSKIYSDFDEVLKCYPNRHVFLNHFENNHVITTKSGLLKTLKYYYSHDPLMIDQNCHVFDTIPISYYIRAHKNDTEYRDFTEKFHQFQANKYFKEKLSEKHCLNNIWFIKPESDNQGKGIILSNNFKEIEGFLISKPVNSGWIVQKAIEKPLLYQGRKFDIRVWVLVSSQMDVYYYNCPYMRTSSSAYSCQAMNSEIHLTNNCQQKHFSEYSKFEEGNTIPMIPSISNHLSELLPNQKSQNVIASIISRMKELILDTLISAKKHFAKAPKKKEFQLFGYDFLIDEDFRTWLLEVNNNPYLGVPNQFIKELLPLMIDEMLEIVVDAVFPPQNYTAVAEKRFELIYKQISTFRITPIRTASSSYDGKLCFRKERSFSMQKSLYGAEKLSLNSNSNGEPISKDQKPRPFYSTPTDTIKYLLENYCFNDLEPFHTPVSLILGSSSLTDQSFLESHIKKIKLITESRISKILLEPKIYELCSSILAHERHHQQIKALIVMGFANACKNFKAKIFLIKYLAPLLIENLRMYQNRLDGSFCEAMMTVLVEMGGQVDRSIFIPGQSRENEFVRELFVKSNALKLLLFMKKEYIKVNVSCMNPFLENLSDKDWELFYEVSQNKAKRAYSPKVLTASENQESLIAINLNQIVEDKPRVLSNRQNAEIKSFRMKKYSGSISLKKE